MTPEAVLRIAETLAAGGAFASRAGEPDTPFGEVSTLRRSLDTVLTGKAPVAALEYLQKCGLFQELFPEIEAIVGFGGRGHKALWPHTTQVVAQTLPKVHLRWAALFHDVGKVATFSDAGKVSFHGHEAKSAQLFARAATRTGLFEEAERAQIRFLIYNLGYVESYESSWSDNAVRRLYRDLDAGPRLADLIALARADITTRYEEKRRAHHKRMHELQTRIDTLKAQDAIPPALPKGLGHVLMRDMGLSPSKELGEVMAKLKALVEAGSLPRNDRPDAYLKAAEDIVKSLGHESQD